MNRGSVFFQNIAGSGNATPYFAFTGNIDFNQFGRVTYREVDGATLTRLAPINFAGNAVGELSIDNTNGTPLANYTVNQNGAVNLNEGSIARFTLDAGSALNLNGGVCYSTETPVFQRKAVPCNQPANDQWYLW